MHSMASGKNGRKRQSILKKYTTMDNKTKERTLS
jgi:hypothetical protein